MIVTQKLYQKVLLTLWSICSRQLFARGTEVQYGSIVE